MNQYNECTPFIYQDPEYGLGFGTECRTKTRWETIQVCNDVYYDDDGNGHTWIPPTDNNSGGGGGYQPVAPKAKAIFSSTQMTDEAWKKLEKMLNQITDDCMGKELYSDLWSSLNGKFISFQFVEEKDASYNPNTYTLKLNQNMDSNELFHEMMHAYQHQKEKSLTSFANARMNLDIEAHYAQYLYLKGSLEYDVSEWRDAVEVKNSKRHLAIMTLNDYLDDKGNIYQGMYQDIVDSYIEFNVVETFKRTPEYEDYSYDSSRNFQSNFANLHKNLRFLRQLYKKPRPPLSLCAEWYQCVIHLI